MEFLESPTAIEGALLNAMESHAIYRWAIAWASTGFPAWDALQQRLDRLHQCVIGTHFHQTHPAAIAALRTHPHVRFITDLSGVFHHKVYLFESPRRWQAIVGSANFTASAFGQNAESAVLISHMDTGAEQAHKAILHTIMTAWQAAPVRIDRQWFAWYTAMWERKQERLRGLANRFGSSRRTQRRQAHDDHDGGIQSGHSPHLAMTWADYVRKIRRTEEHADIVSRLHTLHAARQVLLSSDRFDNLSADDRRRIAGTTPKSWREREGIEWWWFGHMGGSGYFKQSVLQHARTIGDALAHIPMTGPVERDAYLSFLRIFRRLPGSGMATATRLLAIQRPDVFVPINTASVQKLKSWFRVRGDVSDEAYWDSIITRLREDAVWWNAPRPSPGLERQIWDGRAAMLDVLFYEY